MRRKGGIVIPVPLPEGSPNHSGTLRWGWKVGNYEFCPLQVEAAGGGGGGGGELAYPHVNVNHPKFQGTKEARGHILSAPSKPATLPAQALDAQANPAAAH